MYTIISPEADAAEPQAVAKLAEDEEATLTAGPLTARLGAALRRVLVEAAQAMAQGRSVLLASTGTLLTSQQAADLLNVSRQYVVRLMDEGRLPGVRTGEGAGRHRRFALEDVLAYKARRRQETSDALDRLAELSSDAGQDLFEGLPESENR